MPGVPGGRGGGDGGILTWVVPGDPCGFGGGRLLPLSSTMIRTAPRPLTPARVVARRYRQCPPSGRVPESAGRGGARRGVGRACVLPSAGRRGAGGGRSRAVDVRDAIAKAKEYLTLVYADENISNVVVGV